MAGRAPLVALDPDTQGGCQALVSADGIAEGIPFGEDLDWIEDAEKVSLPTVHVHGLADPGLELHRRLLNDYCVPGTTRLVEWDGDHRLPIKAKDVQPVISAILNVAERTGVKIQRL
jgi:hypothetical protein